MIAGIVVLYEPGMENIRHIREYSSKVDIMYILDNSKENHFSDVQSIIAEAKNGIDYEINELSVNHNIVRYQHFESNIGLCAALNYGMKKVKKAGCEWALLMDDDSSLDTDIMNVYKKMLNVIDGNTVAVLAPVHLHDRSKAHMYFGYQEIAWGMTSGCLYNTRIFSELGGFMEQLFVDCLDMDYCYRAHEAGYHVYECGEATLKHHPAETKVFCLFGKEILKYGYATAWRYEMQCKGLMWILLRYKYSRDCATYIWKWLKVILFFKGKRDFFYGMVKGTKEGISLYKDYKRKTATR